MSEYERLLPPLATLVIFEAAYRHGNFSRAAEELFQSQATVSRRVRELETDLGVLLFERHRHNVTPTAYADELSASVRLSLSELSSTAERIRRRAVETESLTILTSLSLASAVVTPILSSFQDRYPGLNIRVLSSCEPIESTREQFDLALQYGPPESDRFNVNFLAEEAVFPVCSPLFANGLPNNVRASELALMPLLHVEYEDSSWATWVDFFQSTNVDYAPVDPAMVFSSYRMCLDVAERGGGVALGWERSVAPRIEAGHLVRIPGLSMPNAALINTYSAKGAVRNDYASEFEQLLQEAMI